MLYATVGHHRAEAARRHPVVLLVVAVIVAAAVTAVIHAAQVDVVPTPSGNDGPGAYYRTDGGTPTAFPDDRLAIGFLHLDQPLERATAVLGPPTTTGPDILGPAFTWALAGGATLTVSADPDQPQAISGLSVELPPGSPARFSAYGGVVVGRSTLAQVVDAWGPDHVLTSSPFDDFAVRYVACIGSAPVVVKFDQRVHDGQPAPTAAAPHWDQPVTTMLVAYADEPAGSAGCPSPS